MSTTDRIERQVEIAAPAQTVWRLVSEPGWFINDGALVEHRLEERGDDLTIVHDPVHGAFPVRTVILDPPRYAAFRWLEGDTDGDLSALTPSSLVEFWIEETGPGRVLLRVVESDLDALSGTEAERRKRVEENTRGWEQELELARVHLEQAGSGR